MTIHYINKYLKKSKIQLVISHLKSIKFFLNFIMGISTFAASIATCVTVLQMRNERNQSYKPYLVIESVDYMDEYTKPVYDVRDIRNLSDSLNIDIENRPQMYLKINNIGAGTATNIYVTFPDKVYKKYWEIACDYYKDEEIEITEHGFNIKKSFCDDRMKQTSHNVYIGDFEIYETHVISGECLNIKLPEEYQQSLRSIAYCTYGDCYRPPVLELSINYEDLQGIHYTETYNIGVDIEVDGSSSETLNYAKYIFRQCKPDINMEDYYARWD